MTIYKCTKCGSDDLSITTTVSIDINRRELIDDLESVIDDELESQVLKEVFCEDCCMTIEAKEVEDEQ